MRSRHRCRPHPAHLPRWCWRCRIRWRSSLRWPLPPQRTALSVEISSYWRSGRRRKNNLARGRMLATISLCRCSWHAQKKRPRASGRLHAASRCAGSLLFDYRSEPPLTDRRLFSSPADRPHGRRVPHSRSGLLPSFALRFVASPAVPFGFARTMGGVEQGMGQPSAQRQVWGKTRLCSREASAVLTMKRVAVGPRVRLSRVEPRRCPWVERSTACARVNSGGIPWLVVGRARAQFAGIGAKASAANRKTGGRRARRRYRLGLVTCCAREAFGVTHRRKARTPTVGTGLAERRALARNHAEFGDDIAVRRDSLVRRHKGGLS